MQTHTFTLLFIGADCISFFFFFLLTTGCSHFVSIKQSEAVTDQIIFTHTYIAPLLLLGNHRVARRVPQLTKMLMAAAIFDHLL